MDGKDRKKKTKGTWSLALGAQGPSMARESEAELAARREMKNGLKADGTDRISRPKESGRRSW